METILKRDGRKVEFCKQKIDNAIKKAFIACNIIKPDSEIQALGCEVVERLKSEGMTSPGVEDIQDMVEAVLVDHGFVRVAKAYILYRAERTRIRQAGTRLMKIYEDITFKPAEQSDIKRENANVDGDTAMGTMLKYGSEGAKHFYNMFVLNPEHAKAHTEGDIHIHDLDFLTLTTTCTQIDLIGLFNGGFSTGHGTLREPNDISSYAALACIAIQSNQNDQHGGQSIANFDYGLAPGVAKTFSRLYKENLIKALNLLGNIEETTKGVSYDGKYIRMGDYVDYQENEKEILTSRGYSADIVKSAQKFALNRALLETDRATYQAMEALIHNLNTMHSRAGAQTPFSSINYGLDTSLEGRMIIKNILLATEAGLGSGETAIFPIHCYRIKNGINYEKEDPNYDLFKLACRVSAKRLFPNFSFIDAPYNLQYYKEGHPETEVAYMGCRTRVMANVADPEREITFGRGNLSFTSINLPRLAIRSKGDIEWFYDELDKKIDLCIDQLLERFEIQASKKVYNYPFLMGQGVWIDSDKLERDSEVREVLKHGTLTVGFIGLAECLKALIGSHHGESEEARNLGLDIVSHMRARMDDAAKKYNLNFSLIATPAEGLSGRFVRIDKEKYGIFEGVTDRDYYTNSFHVPVYYNINAFDKIKIEGPYHALTNAGHISYVELDGDTAKNPEAFEKIVRCMYENGIGYGSINHPVDRDPICGYNGIIDDVCPKCGRTEQEHKFERIRRITGYLVGTLDRFNTGKRAEERDRVKHSGLENCKCSK